MRMTDAARRDNMAIATEHTQNEAPWSRMIGRDSDHATEQSDAVTAATVHSGVPWHSRCGNVMVQEGDRGGVMRAFGMTWVPAAFLAEYTIGFDYTNKVNMLDLLDGDARRHDDEWFIFFDLDAMNWISVDLFPPFIHFGDLHVAEINGEIHGFGQHRPFVFLLTLLMEGTAQTLINVVARAKARWLKKICRREATQNLHSASLVCTKLYKVMSCTALRSELRRRLWLGLLQCRLCKDCIVSLRADRATPNVNQVWVV